MFAHYITRLYILFSHPALSQPKLHRRLPDPCNTASRRCKRTILLRRSTTMPLIQEVMKISGHLAVGPELDLVELKDQLTHQVYKIDTEISLDIFKMDSTFHENENKYQDLKKTILGDESEEEEEEEGERTKVLGWRLRERITRDGTRFSRSGIIDSTNKPTKFCCQ
ncbi:hypothetical protein L2E82_02223 [Cichorium intybus]|uniref:Uncharacterized protein n=1 Tax=Cichorium intybus TaxID=13427 RepID=A0ACB9H0Q4_CICIN|nr:hypothetical protein L2E82_02223 [Cichorium intybus]